MLGLEGGQEFRVREQRAVRFVDRFHDVVEILELTRAENLGMAGEDLLHERAPGARHAQNKERDIRGIAETRLAAHELGRHHLADAVEEPEHLPLLVGDLLPLERTALQHVLEGLSVALEIAVRLAEREMELHLVVFGKRRHLLGELLHRQQIRVVRGFERLGVHQVDEHRGRFRLEAAGGVIASHRLLNSAELLEAVAEVIVGVHHFGLVEDRLTKARHSLLRLGVVEQNSPQQVVRIGILRAQSDRMPYRRFGLLVALELAEVRGEIGVRATAPGVERQGALQDPDRLLVPVELHQRER